MWFIVISLKREIGQLEVHVSAIMDFWIPGRGGGRGAWYFLLTIEGSAPHMQLRDIH
jgi:hypothetical protein